MTFQKVTNGERREGFGPLDLAVRNALDGAAQDLGLVGGGVHGHREKGAVPGLAEEPPEPDRLDLRTETAEAVIDEVDLGQQRRPAEHVDVGVGNRVQHPVLRHPGKGDRHRKEGAEEDGGETRVAVTQRPER
jgi:hypothetical protein